MKRFLKLAVLAITGIAVSMQMAVAQTKKTGDIRIKTALDKIGYKYEVTDSGSYKLVIEMGDGRTHLALIDSLTEKVGNLEIREISSPGYISNTKFSAEIANKLLEDSANKKIGGWQIYKNDLTYLAVFTVKIPANTNPQELEAALNAVVYSADVMEKQLTGKDDL